MASDTSPAAISRGSVDATARRCRAQGGAEGGLQLRDRRVLWRDATSSEARQVAVEQLGLDVVDKRSRRCA